MTIHELEYDFSSSQVILFMLLVGNLNALIVNFRMRVLQMMGEGLVIHIKTLDIHLMPNHFPIVSVSNYLLLNDLNIAYNFHRAQVSL